ncbi:Uncharacterised protein [Niallia circulans]|uniref:hypothetical protein n=1 Tax=Niallia circulans TaxID=1397 RepID=UPI00077C74A2|nr:hypothetical protein [Niallia circulans]MDR4315023.1 hypothetical protein [Niallia circulans]MED3839751.1 hypothetical protein [Niallia circulans]MED4241237.1 hypothetical protein [Niallia circulans]MED4247898.1 hypothetical protein [Niallia circulans]QKH61621.1 hypothetical protein FOC77_13675 [Niallia circulans]
MDPKLEAAINTYLEKKEEDAWNEVKDKMISENSPEWIKKTIKDAFITGFQSGIIKTEQEILEISKTNPTAFYNWLQGK